jgi:hypothetical protein
MNLTILLAIPWSKLLFLLYNLHIRKKEAIILSGID